MRNLKKILSLVLAMMMVLSVMVTASATNFTDDDEIQYKEAVEVMTAAGVLNGVGDEFLPKEALNREAAAKIVAYILTGSELDATLVEAMSNPFSDVNGWSTDVIKYCYANGIIDGMGDGTFLPKGQLTGYAFAKMLLMAIGVNGEYTGTNWKVNIAKNAKSANLLVGLEKVTLGNVLTREQAAQMAFNAMKYTEKGTVMGYTVDGIKDTVFSTYLEAYLMADKDTTKIKTYTDTTDSLLTKNFGITSIANPEDDAFGRPATKGWQDSKGNAVYVEYATPLATIADGSFDYTKTAKGQTWYGWNFEDATVVYNGGTDENVDLESLNGKLGATVELFGVKSSDGSVDVSTVVVSEYYFATIADVNAATKAITLSVEEAGYVISNSSAKEIVVGYDKTKTDAEQSANYKALAGFEKNAVLAVCVEPGWENELVILDVAEPKAVSGTVTAAAADQYYNGYIRIDGVKYTFANEYSQSAVDVGSKGTFYTLNGLVIGFAGVPAASAVTDTVFVVDHYAKYVPAVEPVVDEYGTVIKDGTASYYVIYAQGVDMDGLIVSYPVGFESSSETASSATYTANENAIKLFTAQSDGTYAVSEAQNVAQISINANGISTTVGTTNYYYTSAKYVSLIGSKSNLVVATGTKADAAKAAKAWVVYGQTASSNKTVSKVFYWADAAGEPVPENVFVFFGASTLPEKELVTLKNGTTVAVYTYTVFEAGEAKTIKSYTEDLEAGFFKYYVDEYGVCKESALNGTTATVTNVYANYVTAEGLGTNFDISGIKVVDLTVAGATETSGNGTIETGETIMFYGVQVGNTLSIDCIYIVR